ncbi:hypothetical protein V6N11_019171 [Hibiscus sabdariffa]|uniref:RRM domain-containing protein n=1 Tax=Hibiscus sabdariffa TaxID=183260 RepID=A0ABR2R1P0_9ROSI
MGRANSSVLQGQSKRRKGVAVFVNYVSKRIHPLALREAFSEYGKVLDVYIAFNNRKRTGSRSMFAFVRFSNVLEAMAAVEMTNGRLMDGFRIRTFLDKGAAVESRSLKNSKVANFRSEKMKSRQAGHDKGIDERLYKVVLMLNKGNGKSVEVPVEPVKGSTVGLEASEAMQIVTLEKDSEWLIQCLVRQIKAMYDPEFVQRVLVADGFKVKIHCWSGSYVLIHFEEIEQMEIFWDLKESLLKSWFEDIDTVENFGKE